MPTPELILLVEDSPTQALALQLVLETAGWAVEVCPDGAEAVARVRELTPNLILLDMNLPGLSGREVARRLKADAILSVIPIIFLTGVFRDVEDIISGLDQGADDYLSKSVSDQELVARVRACLRARRTLRELSRLTRLLLSVNKIGKQLAGLLDSETLLRSASELIRSELKYATVKIFMKEGGELVLKSSAGETSADLLADPPHLPLVGNSLAAASARTGSTLPAWHPEREPSGSRQRSNVGLRVAVRLHAAGEVFGVIEVARLDPLAFDDSDKLVLETIADLIGVAVLNARIYRQMEDMAMIDALTGLLNRRAILARLDAEWARSQRHARPLAVLSVDVDGFKRINDGHGHDAGDEAIRSLARAIGHAIRREDFAGRTGGDEFLLILPETTPKGMRDAAERIRLAVERLVTQVPAGGMDLKFTISLGGASWPESPAISTEELLRASDQALYRAKAAGRNRAGF